MTPKAKAALRAAQNRYKWGRIAAMSYAKKHSTISLYRLACQLQAAQKGGF